MSTIDLKVALAALIIGLSPVTQGAAATTVMFSTGSPDGKIATVSQPSSAGKFEIESADDFVLTQATEITSATFTGLLTGNANVSDVVVEIYGVFPVASDVGRTSGPPTFSTPQVPTRVNSPSDVALESKDSASSELNFTTSVLAPSFTAANSIAPGGIHPKPGETTGGNGAITGAEELFNVDFTTPFTLAAGHYFFVPQVEVTDSAGNFYWLSAPKPIVAPGTPFPPGFTDLQSWTRDQFLDPDWLRVGTDIVGAGAFNETFSLLGSAVPEPSTWAMLLLGFAGLGFAGYRRTRTGASAPIRV